MAVGLNFSWSFVNVSFHHFFPPSILRSSINNNRPIKHDHYAINKGPFRGINYSRAKGVLAREKKKMELRAGAVARRVRISPTQKMEPDKKMYEPAGQTACGRARDKDAACARSNRLSAAYRKGASSLLLYFLFHSFLLVLPYPVSLSPSQCWSSFIASEFVTRRLSRSEQASFFLADTRFCRDLP